MHKKDELTKKVKTKKQEIRIVAIGASAGGLSAFESFFSGMVSDEKTGMAFVLIQHLSPEYKSLLPEIINRYTDMNVREIEDGMEILADNVYGHL